MFEILVACVIAIPIGLAGARFDSRHKYKTKYTSKVTEIVTTEKPKEVKPEVKAKETKSVKTEKQIKDLVIDDLEIMEMAVTRPLQPGEIIWADLPKDYHRVEYPTKTHIVEKLKGTHPVVVVKDDGNKAEVIGCTKSPSTNGLPNEPISTTPSMNSNTHAVTSQGVRTIDKANANDDKRGTVLVNPSDFNKIKGC
jgi:hypothetical protein